MGTNKSELKIPVGAMRFGNKGAKVQGNLSMTAYSGGVIRDHFFWGNLAIDLSGIEFSKDKYPILENHDTSRKVGFVRKDQIQKNGNLKVVSGVILDTESGREFSKLSKTGYPWQSSIYAKPSVIEKISEGEKISLNGSSFEGPLTIWAACELREISVCTLGWDQNTEATAFGGDIHALSVELKGFDAQDLADEQLAENIYRLSMRGNKVEPENLTEEDQADEALAEQVFRAGNPGLEV